MTLTSDLSPTRRALLSRTVLAATSLVVPFGQASGQPARSPLNGAAVLTGSLRSSPEARLIAVYHAIAAGDRQALPLAASLVRDVPGFQLGQLVYADLLLSRSGSFPGLITVTDGPPEVREQLQKLRAEANRRLNSLSEMPPPGTVPEQLLQLAPNVQHVVVVDASHSRVYVFEHQASGLQLIRSFYASVGRAGFDKQVEGDLRTPLGIYHITSRLDDQQVEELYGIGALPLNYPNEHDRRMGRTGSGIWLHGVPRVSYARSPYATEGCVALANDDMAYLMRELEPRRTPVIIAHEVKWVKPDALSAHRAEFREVLSRWTEARSHGDRAMLQALSTRDFQSDDGVRERPLKTLLGAGTPTPRNRRIDLKEVSIFRWKRGTEVTVVNFAEVVAGETRGVVKRQYWGKEQEAWKLFYEGVIG
ncbi:L,D-transpeptidase catalytic domain-containing protein [Hydrogenophaga sp. T4]|uniref:L,D-transpeptidase family protein n=1 Tax=Hydrogenophaga sp. TaxID=1904254 RepID=UPI0003F4293A|nr:L,D-transpeptidase [Hydrogenophaga sp.]EWS65827.1 L,D-transpeptidase catalytic domain-containing protein [Hydrogenophaga sp. T4]